MGPRCSVYASIGSVDADADAAAVAAASSSLERMGTFPFFAILLRCTTHDADANVADAVVITICPYNDDDDDDGTHGWFFVNTICFVNIIFYLRAKRNEKKFKIHISNYIRK